MDKDILAAKEVADSYGSSFNLDADDILYGPTGLLNPDGSIAFGIGGNDVTGTGADSRVVGSPWGNSKKGDQPLSMVAQGGADANTRCTASEFLFANGRADIAAHDQSLQLAFNALQAKDYVRALPLFEKAYDKMGSPQAALMAGKLYLFGLGTPRDTAKAVVWLTKAADATAGDSQGFDPKAPAQMTSRSEAAIILARIYAKGYDVPKDPKQARKWYTRADDLGFLPAIHLVGLMWQTGYAGDKDLPKAVGYFTRAGKAGYVPSQYILGQIYYFGGDGVAQDKTQAGAWLLLAAKSGYPDALYAVARMYELGEGGATVDAAKALVYYKEAAVKGQIDAEEVVGLAFYTGQGVPKDLVTARQWFLKASEDANPDAMFNLAVMMTNGEGGPKDLVKAYCWFYIANKGGVEKAASAMQELSAKMTPDERAQADALLNPKAAQ